MSFLLDAANIRICVQEEELMVNDEEEEFYVFPCGLQLSVFSDLFIDDKAPGMTQEHRDSLGKKVQIVHGRHHVDGHDKTPWTIALDIEHRIVQCSCELPEGIKLYKLGQLKSGGRKEDFYD